MLSRFYALLKKHWFNAISLALAVLGLGFAFYSEVLKQSEITVTILAEGSVLDLRRDLPDLVVLFRNEDLRATDQSLRYYSFLVRNTGTTNITKNMFDDQVGWGLQFNGGTVIRISEFSADAILLRPVNPSVSGDNRVKFHEVIFDSGEAFKFDVLVVHSRLQTPSVSTFGGISGTRFKLTSNTPTELAASSPKRLIAFFVLIALPLVIAAVGGAAIAFMILSGYWHRAMRKQWLKSAEKQLKGRNLPLDAARLVAEVHHAGGRNLLLHMKEVAEAELATRSTPPPPPPSDTDEGRRLFKATSTLETIRSEMREALGPTYQERALENASQSASGTSWPPQSSDRVREILTVIDEYLQISGVERNDVELLKERDLKSRVNNDFI